MRTRVFGVLLRGLPAGRFFGDYFGLGIPALCLLIGLAGFHRSSLLGLWNRWLKLLHKVRKPPLIECCPEIGAGDDFLPAAEGWESLFEVKFKVTAAG